MSLDEKLAVVTGAGTGIGRAIAEALADEGARVVAIGRRQDKLIELVNQYQGGGSILPMPGDVADRSAINGLFEQIQQKYGPVQILVNSAGVNTPKRKLTELSAADFDRLVAINLTGTFNTTMAVLPGMRQQRNGLIIDIVSISGKRASVLGGAAYSASKFGAAGFAGVVGLEEAEFGIRCSVIHPGEVETPILDERPVPVSAEHRARILQPIDVAQAVIFIAKLHPRAHVSEMIIKPTSQPYS